MRSEKVTNKQKKCFLRVSMDTNTHTVQSVRISLVYFCRQAGYFRPQQLLSNQTANQAGRGGSHQQQTACPLSLHPVHTFSSLSLSLMGSSSVPPLCSDRFMCFMQNVRHNKSSADEVADNIT